MTSIPDIQQAAAKGVQEITDCPNWGQGGQYVRDPVTGVRTLVTPPHAAEAGDQVEASVTVPAADADPAAEVGDETQASVSMADTIANKEKKRAS